MKRLLLLVLLAATAFAAEPWKVTINDRFGNPLWEVTDARWQPDVVGYDFRLTAKNISGASIAGPFIKATLWWGDKKDPCTVNACPAYETVGLGWGDDDPQRLKGPGWTVELKGRLSWPARRENEMPTSIEVERSGSWKSPAEEAAAKKSQDDAKKAEDESRAACAKLYRQTIDKPERDLTVREAQQIAACMRRGWYHE